MGERQLHAARARKLDDVFKREEGKRLREAKKTWRSLDAEKQMAAAKELVDTRAEELRLAYRDVLAVTYGYRTRKRGGKRIVVRQLCVTFLVKKKNRRLKPGQPGTIPEFLYTYCTVDRRRMLCAVPTDVECDSTHLPRAQRNEQIAVTRSGRNELVTGVITCIVKRPNADTRYAVSCRHVFGMTRTRPRAFPIGAEVSRTTSGPGGKITPIGSALAEVTGIYGLLAVGEKLRISFDAALAEVRQTGSPLQAAIKKFGRPTGTNLGDIERRTYTIWTPEGDKRAKWVRTWTKSEQRGIDYEDLGRVFMAVPIVQSKVLSGRTKGGDSGSPVVSLDGAKLLGMHIAGTNDGSAFMIPAFELLDGFNYVVGGQTDETFQIDLSY
ncbi:MAG: hypothetical protein JXQ75_05540 [Phycisphaerae bacterium]|nr:hypothetical protein [Phycisphaerae bacterium]